MQRCRFRLPYDELARQLKVRQLSTLNRETLLQLCLEEGLLVERAVEPDPFLPIAIRSFLGPAADIVGAGPEDTLLLTDDFRQRYLQADREWQRDIRPKVETFLRTSVRKSAKLRLILDAHASIAFLAGAVLDLKSGVETQLVQKGRSAPEHGEPTMARLQGADALTSSRKCWVERAT